MFQLQIITNAKQLSKQWIIITENSNKCKTTEQTMNNNNWKFKQSYSYSRHEVQFPQANYSGSYLVKLSISCLWEWAMSQNGHHHFCIIITVQLLAIADSWSWLFGLLVIFVITHVVDNGQCLKKIVFEMITVLYY